MTVFRLKFWCSSLEYVNWLNSLCLSLQCKVITIAVKLIWIQRWTISRNFIHRLERASYDCSTLLLLNFDNLSLSNSVCDTYKIRTLRRWWIISTLGIHIASYGSYGSIIISSLYRVVAQNSFIPTASRAQHRAGSSTESRRQQRAAATAAAEHQARPASASTAMGDCLRQSMASTCSKSILKIKKPMLDVNQ